jgi:DNA-binding LacI/PurR family transcriptional regulator
MAAGALGVLAAAGRRVARDVALVGYDDSPIATTTQPALTSVRQPVEEMGREMARLLVDDIARPGRVPRRVVLATELIERASSARR